MTDDVSFFRGWDADEMDDNLADDFMVEEAGPRTDFLQDAIRSRRRGPMVKVETEGAVRLWVGKNDLWSRSWLRQRTWVDKYGVERPIVDMRTSHLFHLRAFLRRWSQQFKNPRAVTESRAVRAIEAELEARRRARG